METDGDFQLGGQDGRDCQVLEGQGRLWGRLGASRGWQLEQIGLQGGAGLPVKGGQNPGEGPGAGLGRLPSLKQFGRACAGDRRPHRPPHLPTVRP